MDLSIVVPILNEAEQLPAFLEMLAVQEGITLELIIVDGGSTDGSIRCIEGYLPDYRWPLRLVDGERGRACQLNIGASVASSDTLLFLHVDSLFKVTNGLAIARQEFESACRARQDDRVAGHFRLKFSRSDNCSAFGYYFWECKARLDRPECIHGDQGFMLRKTFFEHVGPFETDVPIAEDTRLAERVRSTGEWKLFSPEIWTSARRFEVEGLPERQTLNALIMNFATIGWELFFADAREAYRLQAESEELDLVPFFVLIDRLNREAPLLERLHRWYKTGVYVRPNAWQLAFLQDVKAGFARGIPVDEIPLTNLKRHDKWFELVTDNPLGRFVAMLGTWVWYRLTVRRYSRY